MSPRPLFAFAPALVPVCWRSAETDGVPGRHSGVHEAVGILQGQGGGEVTATGMHRVLSQLAVTAPEKAPIGHVVMAFVAPDGAAYCILELDDKAFPKISKMINAEHIKGVSLTHLAETLTPIEVSLCVEPARPGAMIRLATSELKLAILYTDQVKEGKIRTDKTMSAENDKPTEIERVLALLSDADRGIIEDRLIAMSKVRLLFVDPRRAHPLIALSAGRHGRQEQRRRGPVYDDGG